jgi:hypothetical protein
MIQKFLPTGPQTSKMAYEIYRNRNSSDADFKLISEMYARVMQEDKVLCTNAQKNLDRGVFVNGQMHPKFEKAPLFFQSSVREAVTEHFDREKAEGGQIWPARQKLPCDAQVSEKDEEICAGLGCAAQSEVLAW